LEKYGLLIAYNAFGYSSNQGILFGGRNEKVSKNIGTHCDRYWVHVFWVFHDLYFLFSVLLPVRIYYAKYYQFYQINHSSIYFFLDIMLKK